MSAYRWMLQRGIEPERITLAGDSSGGGLVLSLLLTLADQNAPLPGAAVLMCPFLDIALRLKREPDAGEVPVITDDEVRNCVTMYLAGHPVDDPIVDPLSADLTGLPPMLIQAATGDARLADAKALAARARRYGVDVQLQLFPVDAHAFHLFWSFLPEAADAMEAAGVFIRTASDNALVDEGASSATVRAFKSS
jgi:acetyl esterase/lipase